MSWTITPSWSPADADAAAYIAAVEAADTAAGQSGGLEQGVKIAIDNFVLGCKADGIWTAIKASCILAGARTLAGALVPLAGTAPTNYNFVAGDYNRKTGLVGDGSTKYLDSNRNNNSDPQNSRHLSVFVDTAPVGIGGSHIGAGGGDSGASGIGYVRSGSFFIYSRVNTAGDLQRPSPSYVGFIGASRQASVGHTLRADKIDTVSSLVSQAPYNGNTFVFARSGSSLFPAASRLAFYSIGESLDLALLDARVTDLINAFAAAIP